MKKIKILLMIALGILVMNPVSALTTFQVDYSNLLKDSSSLYLETAPVDLTLALEDTSDEFSKLDFQTAGSFDRQIISTLEDRKTLLETKAIPEIDDDLVFNTLDDYQSFRENQIRTEIQNVALQNDELGVLYREVKEYELQLRVDLASYIETEMMTWEREYTDLEADMDDFVLYNKTVVTRSAESEEPSVTDSKIIDLVTENKDDYSDKVDSIEESQDVLLSRLTAANEEEDNSLIVDRNEQLIDVISTDQDILNLKLASLEDEKNEIDKLSTDIELMEVALRTDNPELVTDNPYADMATGDLIVLREESVADLEATLKIYESTQNDVQESLMTSIDNLQTLELKQ